MDQPDFASCTPSSYSNIVDLSASYPPFRCVPNGEATPGSCEHSFDESSYFNTVPHEIMNVSISRVSKGSFKSWLMEPSEATSPESLRLSTSPSQSIATPLSNGFYSPLYPEQPQLPAYELLDQPQSLRTCFTSHPNWESNADNWQHNYSESDIWGTQPFVTQPWISDSYDSYASFGVAPSHAYISSEALPPFEYAMQGQLSVPETSQTKSAAGNRGSPRDEDSGEEEHSSDDDSDWSEENSNLKSQPKSRSPRMQIDRWTVAVNGIQQSDTRGYICDVPGCVTAFVRPEHLRRHVKSKHSANRPYACKVPECRTPFSRGDNLRDHYWTHLHRGGRAGKNKKMTLPELKLILGPKEKKLIRRLKEKQKQHIEKERQKNQRATRLVQ